MSKDINSSRGGADREEFLKGVEAKFPEAYAEIEDIEDELLHLNMADFSRSTLNAIHGRQHELVEAHFEFVSNLFSRADSDLENAIYVSYLENIFLGETEEAIGWVRQLLPDRLATALIELERHFERISGR